MRLLLVAIREDGASKILSYSPDTLPLYLIVQKTLSRAVADGRSTSRRDPDDPWVSVRFSRGGLNPLPGG